MANIVERIDEAYKNGMDYAEQFMLDTKAELIAKGDAGRIELISVCNELGALYREKSRFAESIDNFKLAMETLLAINDGDYTTDYAVLSLNVAGVYRLMREYDEALSLYIKALDIMDILEEGNTYARASLFNNISLTYQAMGEFETSFNYATAGYEIMATLCPGETEEAISLTNLASLALKTDKLDMAESHARKARDIYDTRGTTGGHYPAVINILAVIAFRKGDYEGAIEGFSRSAELTKNNYGMNIDYASALANVGSVYEAMGDMDKANEFYDQAREIKANLK